MQFGAVVRGAAGAGSPAATCGTRRPGGMERHCTLLSDWPGRTRPGRTSTEADARILSHTPHTPHLLLQHAWVPHATCRLRTRDHRPQVALQKIGAWESLDPWCSTVVGKHPQLRARARHARVSSIAMPAPWTATRVCTRRPQGLGAWPARRRGAHLLRPQVCDARHPARAPRRLPAAGGRLTDPPQPHHRPHAHATLLPHHVVTPRHHTTPSRRSLARGSRDDRSYAIARLCSLV